LDTNSTAVRAGVIDSVGADYLVWKDGDTRLQVNFKDDAMFSKEDWALSFYGHEGKRAVIPVDGLFYISTDIMPGDFEGSLRVVPTFVSVESVTRL
jgi:hypothetical protein